MIHPYIQYIPSAQVQGTGSKTCQDTVVRNHHVLFHAIEELGYRVSIETYEVHIEAFYAFCEVTIRSLYEFNFILMHSCLIYIMDNLYTSAHAQEVVERRLGSYEGA